MMINIASPNAVSTLAKLLPDDVQPNAQDIRLDKVFYMSGPFTLTDYDKIHRERYALAPDDDGFFTLPIGSYEISFDNEITMGPDEAGFVITRSTLNRNGVFITTGLYDSGYQGPLAACLHVTCGTALIEKGARIGQFLLWKAEALHEYSGSYGVGGTGGDGHLRQ